MTLYNLWSSHTKNSMCLDTDNPTSVAVVVFHAFIEMFEDAANDLHVQQSQVAMNDHRCFGVFRKVQQVPRMLSFIENAIFNDTSGVH